jgi:hypothetical protein
MSTRDKSGLATLQNGKQHRFRLLQVAGGQLAWKNLRKHLMLTVKNEAGLDKIEPLSPEFDDSVSF